MADYRLRLNEPPDAPPTLLPLPPRVTPHPTRPRTNAPAASPSANNTVATTTMEGPAGVSQVSEAARAAGVS